MDIVVDILQGQLKEGGRDRLDPTYSLDAATPCAILFGRPHLLYEGLANEILNAPCIQQAGFLIQIFRRGGLRV